MDALLLSGGKGADVYHITQANWNHHGVISIDNTDTAGTGDRLILPSTVNTQYILAGVNGDDLVLTDALSRRSLVFKGAMKSGSESRHLTISYGNNQSITLDTIHSRVKTATGGDNTSHVTIKAFSHETPESGGGIDINQQIHLRTNAMAQQGSGSDDEGGVAPPNPEDRSGGLTNPGI